MATKSEAPTDGEGEREKRAGRRLAAVIKSVMDALGKPGDLLRTTARSVNGDTFRVNVVTGPDVSSARIAHSFFLTADESGNVTGSTPAINKCY